jgi:amino acid adenylation domain-containing protein
MRSAEALDLGRFRQLTTSQKRQALLQLREALLKSAGSANDHDSARKRPSQEHLPFPLTDIQQSFLVSKHFSRGQDHVGCHIYIEISELFLDQVVLEQTWATLLETHLMLRVKIIADDQHADPQQVIPTQAPQARFITHDLTHSHAEAINAHLATIRQHMEQKVYLPEDWPYYDIVITQLPCNQSLIHMSVDEWILDGASLGALLRQWYQLYVGEISTLPGSGASFRDYVIATRELEKSARFASDLAYWICKLETMPAGPSFPIAKQPSVAPPYRRVRKLGQIDEKTWHALKRLCKRINLAPTTLLLTLFCEALRSRANEQDFSLVLTLSNRLPLCKGVDALLGPFISTSLFISRGDHPNLQQQLEVGQQQVWDDMDHCTVSAVRALRELKNRQKLAPSASIPVVFTSMLSNVSADTKNGGTWLTHVSYAVTQTPQVYLDHQTFEKQGRLCFSWDYADGILTAEAIEVMVGHYSQLLVALAKDESLLQKPASAVLNSVMSSAAIPQKYAREMLTRATHAPERRFAEFPLTDVQQAYFVSRSSLIASEQKSCVIYQEIDFEHVDEHNLLRAWRRLVDAHDGLRTIVTAHGTQKVVPSGMNYEVHVVDQRLSSEQERQAALSQVREEMSDVLFALGQGPFFQLRVTKLPAGRLRMHIAVDMIIADGNSVQYLLTSLMALILEPRSSYDAPAISFRNYCDYLTNSRATEKYANDRVYWEQRVADLLPGPAFLTKAGSATQELHRERFEAQLQHWSVIVRKARSLGVDPAFVLLAAYAEVLLEWNRQQSFSIVVVNWDRPPVHPDIDRVIGDFTQICWLEVSNSDRSFEQKVVEYSRQIDRDLEHGLVSGLSEVRRRVMRDRTAQALQFPVVFTRLMSNAPTSLPNNVTLGYGLSQTPQVYLDNISFVLDQQLHFHWDAVVDVYPRAMVEKMFAGYRRLLEVLSLNTDAWVSSSLAAVIDSRARSHVPEAATADLDSSSIKGAVRDYPLHRCLHHLIEEAVCRHSQQIAVCFEGRYSDYSSLNARANRLAHFLREQGVRADTPVALMLHRSPELVVCLLAILKAGGAYLPIDAEFPPERIDFILRDARVAIVLTDSSLASSCTADGISMVLVDRCSAQLERYPDTNLKIDSTSDQLAYILYTSGSTGEPKGCMVSHKAVVNRLLWMRDEYEVTAGDRVLQKTPYTFDVSVWEFFLPMLCGATLVLAKPKGHQDAAYLVELIRQEQVSVCHFVPSMLNVFLKEAEVGTCLSLKSVFTSGEALSYSLMVRCKHLLHAHLHNLYGPTEAAIDVTYWPCRENASGIVPIGKPVANTQIHILDESLNSARRGEVGELHIGGVQLARGYLNRPELTADKFIRDPFSSNASDRLYKTGDLARVLPDGNVEYLGRNDCQVKLRGLRIELTEIEAHLLKHEGISAAAVTVKEIETDDPKLVAYIVESKPSGLSLKEVRSFLRNSLPEYMLPNAVVTMCELPLTLHGKLDRKALAWPVEVDKPDMLEAAGAVSAATKPTLAELTESISGYVREALQIETIDAADNLFDLGATSLTLVRLSQRLKESLNIVVPVDVFLDTPTVAAIAGYLHSKLASRQQHAAVESSQFVTAALSQSPPELVELPDIQVLPQAVEAMVSDSGFSQDRLTFRKMSGFLALLKPNTIAGKQRYLYPSGGDKNAVQVYLYVKPDAVEGLVPGYYYYHPVEHVLYLLSNAPAPDRGSFSDDQRALYDGCSFSLFFIAQYHAIEPFYVDGSTTLVELDTGYMSQLLLSRQADFGIGLRAVNGFDFSRIEAGLRLNDGHRFIACMLGGAAQEHKCRTRDVEDHVHTSLAQQSFHSHFSTPPVYRSQKYVETDARSNRLPSLNAEELQALSARQLHLRDCTGLSSGIRLTPWSAPDSDYLLRSCQRDYEDSPLSFEQLSGLLALMRRYVAGARSLPIYPSAAHLFSVGAYVYAKDGALTGLAGGLYRYDSCGHTLQLVHRETAALDAALKSAHVPFNRTHYAKSKINIFLVSDLARFPPGVGDYATRLVHIEAGHIGQLMMDHQSEWRLGVCPIGGMRFDKLRSLFRLAPNELFIHCLLVGAKAHSGQISKPFFSAPVGGATPVATLATESADRGVEQTQDDIAIIGISGRYPGADNLDEFWELLRQGKSAITAVGPERWDANQYFDADSSRDKSYSKWAGFLSRADSFDSLLFKIAPNEAKVIDPQERLFLEAVWECLENAGYTSDSLRDKAPRVGVFVGVMWNDYQNVAMDSWHTGKLSRAVAFHSSIANRVSHVFDFQGPSVAIDTSCSSSLTAIHMAIECIRNGECDAAIVGGVNLITHPYHQNVLCGLNLLSKDEVCRALGAEGTGWVAGEGVGAILIRPLSKAERCRDHVHGLIKATAIGHLGRTARYGLPSQEKQARSIQTVLDKAGISADGVNYVESAATGSGIADAAELNALQQVFATCHQSSPCAVGSVKPNIGHLESASFMSQLTKVLLQMRHRRLAPSINSEPLNPLIQLSGSPLYVNKVLQEWPSRRAGRRALINAFGATGSSGHMILDSYALHGVSAAQDSGERAVILSAATRPQLMESARRLATYVERYVTLRPSLAAEDCFDSAVANFDLASLSFTLQTGRVAMSCRLAIVARSLQDLYDKLALAAHMPADGDTIFHGEVAGDCPLTSADVVATSVKDAAQRWVRGESVDWRAFHHGSEMRVPLPTYPFLVERHWLDQSPVESQTRQLHEGPTMNHNATHRVDLGSDLNEANLLVRAEEYFRDTYAELSGIAPTRINTKAPLIDYGVNSLLITQINTELEKHFNGVSKTVMFECQTLHGLAKYFLDHHPLELTKLLKFSNSSSVPIASRPTSNTQTHSQPRAMAETQLEDIAIIGLGGRYPQAENLAEFWNNLVQGKDCIVEVPAERWAYQEHSPQNRWGGFLQDVDKFDPLFFNISPTEAQIMDPQERLFLQVAWEAVEDAGYTRDSLSDECQGSVGVFVGVMYGEYQLFGAEETARGNKMSLGSVYGSIANRVSYALNLFGPSMAVDTLCSSSLTALHLAGQSIRSGECEVAIAGGVNLSLHPNKYIMHAQMNMPSSDGRCHAFGEGGDGFVPGEGVGAVVLKRYSQALLDGDHIYGLIKATAVNHDGKTNGYTVPNPLQHSRLIQAAIANAKINPRDISYIEAHGTGTALGDPIEITGLTKAFRTFTDDTQFCAIGSVKSNIGHLESAAGIAALTKVLLQMAYRKLVPSLHSQTLNSNIRFESTPFYVQRQLSEWSCPARRSEQAAGTATRVAGISSFGAGGANAHVIISETPSSTSVVASAAQEPLLFVLSAKNKERLATYVQRWIDFLEEYLTQPLEQRSSFENIVYTAQIGRESMPERLAVVVQHAADLLARLQEYARTGAEQDVLFFGNTRADNKAQLMLVNGAEADEIVGVFIKHNNLRKLAQLWVSGTSIRWQRLYTQSRMRVSVPTYPFAKESYWAPRRAQAAATHLDGQPKIHPLLDCNVSSFDGIAYKKQFAASAPLVTSHEAFGKFSISAGTLIEMIYAAGCHASSDRLLTSIHNLSLARPLHEAKDRLDVMVRLYPAPDKCAAEAVLHFGPHTQALALGSLRYRSAQQVGLVESYVDINALKSGLTPITSIAQHLHGSAPADTVLLNSAVKQAWASDTMALAELQTTPRTQGEYLAGPALFDAILGCVSLIGASDAAVGRLLPLRIGELCIRRPVQTNCYVHVQPSYHVAQSDAERSYDVRVIDAIGRECLYLREFSVQQVVCRDHQLVSSALDTAELFYKRPEWQAKPLAPVSSTAEQAVLLFDTNEDLFNQFRSAYEGQSSRVVLVKAADSYQKTADGRYQVHPANEENYQELFTALASEGFIPTTVVHHWSKAPFTCNEEAVNRQLQGSVHSLIYLTRTIVKTKLAGRVSLLYLYSMSSGEVQPCYGASGGLLKAIAFEAPQIRCKTIGFNVQTNDGSPANDCPTPQLLLNERIDSRPNEQEVRYEGGCRYVKLLSAVEPRAEQGAAPLSVRDGGAYLITGGCGGLGLIFAQYLAARGGKLVLTGRSQLNDDIAAHLQSIRLQGAEAIYIRADVSKQQDVQELVRVSRERYGHIQGVIHAAGVLHDGYFLTKSTQQVQDVLSPKIIGTVYLDEALQAEPLDWMVLFASIVGVLGNVGQSDYAYANAFLDEFAKHRNSLVTKQQRHGKTLSLNWPLWAAGGMSANDQTVEAMKSHYGLVPLSTAAGLMAFEEALQSNLEQVLVLAGHPQVLNERLHLEDDEAWQSPYLRAKYRHPVITTGLEEAVASMADSPAVQVERSTVSKIEEAAIDNGSPTDTANVESFIRTILAGVTGVVAAQIDPRIEFWELGLDSILAMKVIEGIQTQFQLRLYPNEMLEYNNVEKLTRYLENELASKSRPTSGADVPASATGEGDRTSPLNDADSVRWPSQSTTFKRRPEPAQAPVARTSKKVLFVLSTPRAGSTLLRVMLGGHSQIFAPPELHLLPYETLQQWSDRLIQLNQKYIKEGLVKAISALESLSVPDAVERVAELQRQGFSIKQTYDLMLDKSAGRFVVDKSPNHALSLDTLRRAESVTNEPYYVHLVRNPIAVMESFVRNRFDRLFAVQGDPWKFTADMWADMNANICTAMHDIPEHRKLRINYETLVSDPDRVMRSLCTWLGLPFEETLLQPYEGDRMTDGLHANSMPIGDPNFLTYSKIEASFAESWQEHLDKVSLLEPRTLLLARDLGYALSAKSRQAVPGMQHRVSNQRQVAFRTEG